MTRSTRWGMRGASGQLRHGIADDPEGQLRTIARDLREGRDLDDATRQHLADMLDPDGESLGKLVYGHRAGGRPRTLDRIGKEVAAYAIVEERSRARTKNAAVLRAVRETGLTRAQVYEVLKKYGSNKRFGPNNL